ncbi:MAG: GNAT family N-acetyltransferase [Natronomonas sp.]
MYEGFDIEASGLPPQTREKIVAWLKTMTERGWNLIARADDNVIGHVGVMPATAAEPEFVIFVDEEYQGRGIGTELVKQVVAYAAARGHNTLELNVEKSNERAISIYQNLSFELTKEELMTIAMQLSLEKPIAEDVQRPPVER